MKIILIDDHPLVRRGLSSILSSQKEWVISGEAATCKEALYLIQELKPDLILVDLRLGQESGLDFIVQAKGQGSTCKFVVLTSSTATIDFEKAKEIGVDGYISKEALPEELIHALSMISRGRKYYDPSILELYLQARTTSFEENDFIEQLTPKEKEVLLELGMGHSNKEISQTLFITEYTVKKHVSQVLAKLGLTDRTHAALFANATGLVHYKIS